MGTTDHAVSESKFPSDSEAIVNEKATDLSLTRRQTGHPDVSPLSYWQRMTRISITPGDFKAFIRHVYQPFFVLATFPAVAYTAILYGSLLSWYSVIAVTQSRFFAVEPYNFSTVGIGLLSLPAFIGCVFGAVYSGPLSDWSIQWFAKRNNNIYEPEMRLYIAILPVLLGPVGLWLYGYSLAKVWDFLELPSTDDWPLTADIGGPVDCSLRGLRNFRFCPSLHVRLELDISGRFLRRRE